MTLTAWLSLVVICCLGAMSPGPSLAVVLKQTVRHSRTHALAASWFHAAGVGLWAFASISGLGLLVTRSATAFQVITWGGAAYLAWLGFNALRASARNGSLEVGQARQQTIWQAGVEGAMISLLNPKLAVFFIALFSQFVTPDAGNSQRIIMTATPVLIDGIWYSLVALLLSRGPVLSALQRHSQLISRITGLVLIGLAIRVATL